jgi:hypothetical protein
MNLSSIVAFVMQVFGQISCSQIASDLVISVILGVCTCCQCLTDLLFSSCLSSMSLVVRTFSDAYLLSL